MVRMDGGICEPPTVVDIRLRQLERRRDPRRLFPDGVLRHQGERVPLPMGRDVKPLGWTLTAESSRARRTLRSKRNSASPANATAPKLQLA